MRIPCPDEELDLTVDVGEEGIVKKPDMISVTDVEAKVKLQ